MNSTAARIHVIEGRGSWRSRALNTLLRVAPSRRLRLASDLVALRGRYEALDRRHAPGVPGMVREAVQCGSVAAEWVSVPESRPDRTLLYLHGGSFAFRFPNTHAAFAARMCRRLGARALVPDYRLAPEHPFPAAPDDCHAAYRWLLANGCAPGSLVLIGDSAGGCLALVTLHRLRQTREPQPACAVLLSPAVDCTLDSHSMVDNEGRDPLFRLGDLLVLRRHYVPSPQLYTHPEVSPLFADFTGFAPLLLQTGSDEMLRDEAVRTAHKAHAAGVDVELELWPDTPHSFQVAPFLPESARALNHISAFVAARTGWSLDTPGAAAPAPTREQTPAAATERQRSDPTPPARSDPSAGIAPPRPGDALIVVDVQRDFLPGGSLAVRGGDAILAPVKACIERFVARGLPVFASRDWHPPGHASFRTQGGPWPPHCVAGTPGAEFPVGLALPGSARVVSKGIAPGRDAYSAFDGTDLHRQLRACGVHRLFIAGLATDYCVLASVLDARALGYGVVLLRDAMAAVDLKPGDGERALQRMVAAGAQAVESAALPA